MKEHWTTLVIGIIMISSPWILGFSDISLAKWCNVLIGLLLAIIAAWTIFAVPATPVAEDTKNEKTHKK